jgi:predicted secreted protein
MKNTTLFIIIIIVIMAYSCKANHQSMNGNNSKISDSIAKEFNMTDTIKIELEKNFSGGYEWEFEPNKKIELLSTKDSIFLNQELNKSENTRTFEFKALKKGEIILSFNKKRSFEPDSLKLKNLQTEKIFINNKKNK